MNLHYITSPTTQSIFEALDMLYERRVALDELINSLQNYQTACDETKPTRARAGGRGSERRLAS
jgi:hypothetical protein